MIGFSLGLAAGCFFLFASPISWIAGIALFFLHDVFDYVDGGIARSTHRTSLVGAYLDMLTTWITWPWILGCMSVGIYRGTHEISALVFGLVAVGGFVTYTAAPLLVYPILHEKGLLASATEAETYTTLSPLIRFARVVFGSRGFIPSILVLSLLDALLSRFSLWGLNVNLRWFYLGVFALATVAGVAFRGYGVFRDGVKLKRFV
jgi:phosphatidylglycerophosphate synthase